VLDRVL
jgi:hypothetical protein